MERLPVRVFDQFTHDVIVVDGLWGSGKQLVNAVVGSYKGVEHYKYNADYDYFLALAAMGDLDSDVAVALLQLLEGRNQYYGSIGREINLRFRDESGLMSHPSKIRWLRRLIGPDGDDVAERIDAENIASNLMAHCVIGARAPLETAFGSRLRFIEVVRHPVHLVRHWTRFLGPKLWRRKREFNLSVDYSGEKVPWFAASWAEAFVGLTVADRACLSVSRMSQTVMDEVSLRPSSSMMALPFEQLVLQPELALRELTRFLGRRPGRRLSWVLRRNGVPRRQIADGPRIGQSYRWTAGGSDEEVYRQLADEINREVSGPVRDEFWATVSRFNRVFPGPLAAYE